jgi:hypothetical protein
MGAAIPLMIPAVTVAVYILLAASFLIYENKRGMNALTSSWYYVRGYWWATFGRTVGVSIIIGLVVLIVNIIIGLVIALLLGTDFSFQGMFGRGSVDEINLGADVTAIVFNFIYTLIFLPIVMYPWYVIYRHLKSVKPEPTEMDLIKPKKWFVGLSIWGIVGSILLILLAIVLVSFAASEYRKLENSRSMPTIEYSDIQTF